MYKTFVISLIALISSGTTANEVKSSQRVPLRLIGTGVTSKAIKLTVVSNGCTRKDDFKMIINCPGNRIKNNSQCDVQPIRIETDRCRAGDRPVTLEWPFDQLDSHLHQDGIRIIVNAPEEPTRLAIGFNSIGTETACYLLPENQACTKIFTEEEAYQNRCLDQGAESFQCDCHRYLCSESVMD
ncbi:MAG: hypothetical protein CMP10_19040 [Zetaproteobacteria bacterium]|nr:hypothetical protein [Pseudobdellovibrionaceae bacterium]